MLITSPAERFWLKVNKNGAIPRHAPHLGPCWLWTGARRSGGYGHVNVAGRFVAAHRFALQLTGSQPRNDLAVLHRCDNPPCVNPEHLRIGTQAENVHDMISKGRQRYVIGESNASAKLTASAAIDIYHCNEANAVIAARFGIDQTVVSRIKTGKAWQHATGATARHGLRSGSKCPSAKLSEDQVREILSSTESTRIIARRIGIDASAISRIRTGKIWKSLSRP